MDVDPSMWGMSSGQDPRCPEATLRRVKTGRNIALSAMAVFCVVRGAAYLPGLQPDSLITPVAMISLNGHLLWVWTLAWFAAAVLCLVDMVRGQTRVGMSFAVGLTFMWGASYLVAWALLDFGSRQWFTGATLACTSVIIFGLLQKIGALRDVIEHQQNNPTSDQGA